jgi:hypothetical protein
MVGHEELGLGGNDITDAGQYTKDEIIEKFAGFGTFIKRHVFAPYNTIRDSRGLEPLTDIPHLRIHDASSYDYKEDLKKFLQKMPDKHLLVTTDYDGRLTCYNSETGEVNLSEPVSLTSDSADLKILLGAALNSMDDVYNAKLSEAIELAMPAVDELGEQMLALERERQKLLNTIAANRDSIPEITE